LAAHALPLDIGSSGMNEPKQRNEGEGNKTAAREFNREQTEFAQSGKVRPAAEKAKRAVEGAERDELEHAEKTGEQKARH
jgi:hypothetical protein